MGELDKTKWLYINKFLFTLQTILRLFQNDAAKITIRTPWVAYISYIYSM